MTKRKKTKNILIYCIVIFLAAYIGDKINFAILSKELISLAKDVKCIL